MAMRSIYGTIAAEANGAPRAQRHHLDVSPSIEFPEEHRDGGQRDVRRVDLPDVPIWGPFEIGVALEVVFEIE